MSRWMCAWQRLGRDGCRCHGDSGRKACGDVRWEQDAAATGVEFAVGRMGLASRAAGGAVGEESGGVVAGVEATDGATAVASCELDTLDAAADAVNVVEGVDEGEVV